MPEIHNPYGSPCSDAPADTANNSTTDSPLKLTPTDSVDSLSQLTSISEQMAALKRQLAELEEEKRCLTKSAIDANQRAYEAEKRTASAETETTAAKQRAQNRYTEKLHANNEVRHLRAAIEKQDAQRRGYLIQVENCFNGLKAKIIELECVNKDQGTKVQSLQSQLDAIRTSLSSCEEEKAKLKTESDNIIKDLKRVIVGQQSSLETADQAKESMKDDLAKLKARMKEQGREAKAKDTSLTKSNQELKKSESSWRLKFKGMQERVNVLEEQTNAAQKQGQAARQQLDATREQLHTARQQLEASRQQAKQDLAGAKQQYLMAVRNIRQNAALGIQQLRQQQPQLHHQPQRSLLQQNFIPNKKRKLDSNGDAAFNANALQPTYTQASNSGSVTTTHNTLGGSNSFTAMAGTPDNMKKSLMMVPNGAQGQFSSIHANTPIGSTAPVCQMQQPRYCSQSTISPIQQGILSTQSTGSMKPQQPSYPQGVSLENVGSLPQNDLPKPQDLPLDFSLDFPHQPFPDITIDTLLSMDMPQVNNANVASLSNSQGNDPLSGFGDDVMADSGIIGPQNEDLFKDLFNDDAWGLFGDLSEIPSQGQS